MISAYPLTWPAGWPRTKARKGASFCRTDREYSTSGGGGSYTRRRDITVADGVERVRLALTRLGVEMQDLIISTDVRTRLDGLPRSGEREPDDPGAAVYWQERSGQTRVMAIDRYDRVADNLAAIAATLEALRAIERHGGGQILDRAFTGFAALPAPDARAPWWQTLGLAGPTTDAREIEQAYRSMAALHHPDRGGDGERMAEINRARDEGLAL